MKKYTAATVEAALAAIRAELGPEAVIVHQSETKRGPLGLLSRAQVEVVAAGDDARRPAAAPAARPAAAPARPRGAAAPVRSAQTSLPARPPRPSLRPHPVPFPEGEGTRVEHHASPGPSLNPQPSTLNPSE